MFSDTRVGWFLLSVGFLAATFVMVRNPDHVNWLQFSAAMIIAARGAWRIRAGKKAEATAEGGVAADIGTVRESLDTILTEVEVLQAQGEDIDVFGVCKTLDAKCMEPINLFVEARDSLTTRFGLTAYADIMGRFARGERALNRAWCASADGYIDEVRLCLDRAHDNLSDARNVFAKHDQSHAAPDTKDS